MKTKNIVSKSKSESNSAPKIKGGMKEAVKKGIITARDGYNQLLNKAEKDGGTLGAKLFFNTPTAKWLRRRF